jgi:hypothetical protein
VGLSAVVVLLVELLRPESSPASALWEAMQYVPAEEYCCSHGEDHRRSLVRELLWVIRHRCVSEQAINMSCLALEDRLILPFLRRPY